MRPQTVCVLGGTGFIGRSCVNELVRNGHHVLVPTRHREKNRHNLILLPGVELMQMNVYHQSELNKLFGRCDTVINCIGILNEREHDGSGFNRVHAGLVLKSIEAVRVSKVSHFIQMSAIGADYAQSNSAYMRSKGEAEVLLKASANLRTSIMKLPLVFGPGDGFFPRFAKLLRLSPILPLPCPRTRLMPVYVRDVARAAVEIMQRNSGSGIYRLCGPKEYSMLQLVQYTAACLRLRRHIMPLSDPMSYMQALLCEYIPGKPFSISMYHAAMTAFDSSRNDLPQLGIKPTALELVVPQMLRDFKA